MPSRQATRVVFTTNNYTQAHEQAISDFLNGEDVRYGIFGREVGESGTRHLQGFAIVTRQRTLHWFRNHLPHSHIEFARGTSQQARDYCKKDGDFLEFGDFPANGGSRSDLQQLFEWSDEFTIAHGRAPNSPEVARAFPREYTKYPRLVRTLFHRADPPELQTGQPRQWQADLAAELEEEADRRSVIFYVDPDGGNGKTWFQQWFFTNHPNDVQILSIGKRDDLAHVIDPTKKTFFFNVPRGGMEYFQYTIAEQLKDRMVFSPKYNSRMKFMMQNVHVVVFCNEDPDMEKMTEDRYILRNEFNI